MTMGALKGFVQFWCVAVLSSGCSFVFVEPVPAYHHGLPPEEPVDCTSAKAAPIIDTVLAGSSVVAAGVAGEADEGGGAVAANLAFAVLYSASAVYGYVTTRKCYDAKAERAERLRRAWHEQKQSRDDSLRSPEDQDSEQQDLERRSGSGEELKEAEPVPAESNAVPDVTSEEEPSPEDLERWGGPSESE